MELLVHFEEKDQWQTDLLHLHDWQSALCAVYLRIDLPSEGPVQQDPKCLDHSQPRLSGIISG